MIVDTSALIAIVKSEPVRDTLLAAVIEGGIVPAPAIVEFRRVMTRRGSHAAPEAESLLSDLLGCELTVEQFTADDAEIASRASVHFGSGNGRGGTLNLLDLMVYAMAKRTGRAILCTGRDFAATDADLHLASRRD